MAMNGASSPQKSNCHEMLPLAGDKSLSLDGKELVIHDASGRRSISLYNVLWAELSGAQLTVSYATQSSKAAAKPESWTGQLPDASSKSVAESFISALLTLAYGDAQIRKRAYVLVNPNSGPGGALRKWERDVRPLLEAARMELDVVTLTRGGEAVDLVEKVDIEKYDTIMACSGDGTPHEVFNGLAKRPDALKALSKIAVSHIPCGSGNAMSCNLYGSHKPTMAALAIIKGVVTPLDLISITQEDRRFVSFLSQAIGIIAESDLATENLRWMGSARFDLGVFTRVFRRKCYPCDLAVKVEVGDEDGKDGIKSHYRNFVSDGSSDMALTTSQNGDQVDGDEEGLPPLKHGTVKDKLPEGWELVSHENIGTFYCGNMAYMAPDANFFSAAIAADGCMDLVIINGDLPPITALKTLLSVESGKFFDSPQVCYKKISAYRLIPRNQKDGYISIDGERVPFAPFQAEVHRGLGRVISKRGCFEASGPMNWEKAGERKQA
ncbi:hypothetical protein HIM_07277 [Hirsutella minnesotensis 3608]|uniref:DAGKc domain-containing protein n=1 Tax=Hirsutella minnesotensis 3608 TaxID=1043627 RepID=A0A0F7ZTK5_9HYPO|nr:hypothetical protein HIM_07277 [Hirsutella minnesotensis 3608]